MFHGHETMKHLQSGTVTTELSIFIYLFLVDGVSWYFTALFHAVSLLFHAVSRCFTALFHAVSLLFHAVSLLFHGDSSLCFMVFQGVSFPCLILFHYHESGAVGTSLKSRRFDPQSLRPSNHRRRLADLHSMRLRIGRYSAAHAVNRSRPG